jgi:hypothetical protein
MGLFVVEGLHPATQIDHQPEFGPIRTNFYLNSFIQFCTFISRFRLFRSGLNDRSTARQAHLRGSSSPGDNLDLALGVALPGIGFEEGRRWRLGKGGLASGGPIEADPVAVGLTHPVARAGHQAAAPGDDEAALVRLAIGAAGIGDAVAVVGQADR